MCCAYVGQMPRFYQIPVPLSFLQAGSSHANRPVHNCHRIIGTILKPKPQKEKLYFYNPKGRKRENIGEKFLQSRPRRRKKDFCYWGLSLITTALVEPHNG